MLLKVWLKHEWIQLGTRFSKHVPQPVQNIQLTSSSFQKWKENSPSGLFDQRQKRVSHIQIGTVQINTSHIIKTVQFNKKIF